MPGFCKKYARVGLHIDDGLAQFKREVEEGAFPGEEYSPYKMSEDEEALFGELTLKDGPGRRESGGVGAATETEEPDAAGQLNLFGGKSVDGKRKVGVWRNEEMPGNCSVVFEREGFDRLTGDCCFEGRWSSLF